ncbi:hypothetical protein Taro_004976 [Colocasia esculenta]|uniref:Uncharacterized protein n=1 Tax=Colocasia esculenta TaxID=4460 RepID=A0A843TRR7_COLES|nr:hypothetical protein [Colocasia esculenta]
MKSAAPSMTCAADAVICTADAVVSSSTVTCAADAVTCTADSVRFKRMSQQRSLWHTLRGQQQQQWYQPPPQQYTDWFPMAKQFFRAMFHGTWQPGQTAAEGQPPVPLTVVLEQQANLQAQQPADQLLRHVPHVAGSEQACAERFIVGLRSDLRWGMTTHMCATLGVAVAKATALERETWQPQQQQQQGRASSRTTPYQRPTEFESLVRHTPERQCDVMVDLPLYALQLRYFDVILGVDWLEAHSAVVDCQWKTMRFEMPGTPIVCFQVEEGDLVVLNNRDNWTEDDRKKISLNCKAKSILCCALSKKEFNRVSACKSAMEMWEKLRITYECTNKVKETKIDILVTQYERFQMQSGETITQMFSRFTDITNGLAGLGKSYEMRDMVRKILRSLPSSWTPKVTAIEEANDLKRMSLEKLIGSLMAHEINMERLRESSSRKKHSNALKAAEDNSEEESENEDSSENSEDEEALLSRRL